MLSSPIESLWLQVIRNQYDLSMSLIHFSMSAKDCSIWDGFEADMTVVFEVNASNAGIYGLGAGDVVSAEIIDVLSVDMRSWRTKATGVYSPPCGDAASHLVLLGTNN